MKVKNIAVAALCVLLLAGAAAQRGWARQVTVTTTAGQTFTGELVEENADGVTLKIEGVTVSVARADTADVKYGLTIREQYTQRRAELDEQDADAWYRLAYWLFENKAYDLALDELKRMGQRYPDDARISRLGAVVDAKAKLAEQPPADRPAPRSGERDSPAEPADLPEEPTPTHDNQIDARTLNDEQINAIKVWELDLDNAPAVTIPRDVIDDFLTTYHGQDGVPRGRAEQARFRVLPGREQLAKLFELKARRYYPQVNVRGDPDEMRLFRTSIHQRYILNYCGTNRCHGGEDFGGLSFVKASPNSEATAYTNFFILHAFETPRWYMIDRSTPEDSLLLQFGMDRRLARAQHPDVDGWRPRFADTESNEYRRIREWIGSLQRPTPNYGIVMTSAPSPDSGSAGDGDTDPPADRPGE